jgi:hypothetical protein
MLVACRHYAMLGGSQGCAVLQYAPGSAVPLVPGSAYG